MTVPHPETHAERIKRELREAGVGRFGFTKFAVRYLYKIIHPSEHVHGVVYGRYKESNAIPAFEEGMLVATDRRVLFVDRKPGFLRADEITYDVVSGVQSSTAALFSAVTLYTRIGEFTIRFARNKCAAIFVHYVEKRRLETLENMNGRNKDY